MANASTFDVGVLILIVLGASLANGSSSSKDVSQGREAEVFKQSDVLSAAEEELTKIASQGEERPCPTCQPPPARRRNKRCTCYTYKDKECVYYCHLDIIWINTPEHTVPYGMSSYQGMRMRRSIREKQGMEAIAQRCLCIMQSDSGCSSFCMNSIQGRPPNVEPEHDRRTAFPALETI